MGGNNERMPLYWSETCKLFTFLMILLADALAIESCDIVWDENEGGKTGSLSVAQTCSK